MSQQITPSETMSDKALKSRLYEVQHELIKSLLREAIRLGNADDTESLNIALAESTETDFDLSRYWGYDTRADAPALLKQQVAEFEQLQGDYFERQAAVDLAIEERRKRRKGFMLIGTLVLMLATITAWARFIPNRFSIDMRQRNLRKLKFLPSFSHIAGQPMADVTHKMLPPAPRFTRVTRTYERLANAAPTSMYNGTLGAWQITDDKGKLVQLLLIGSPDKLTRQRLHKALLPLLLRNPKAARDAIVTTGLIRLPGSLGAAILPTLRLLERETKLVRFHSLPTSIQARTTQRIQRKLATKTTAPTQIAFADLLGKHTEGVALVRAHHPRHKGPLSFRLSLKKLGMPDAGSLMALLQAEVAPWLAPPHKGKGPPPLAPPALLPKAMAGTFDLLLRPGLWDAALRNTSLPIARYQQSFGGWRHEHRKLLWLALYQKMLDAHVDPKDLQGPQVIFQVQQEAKTLVVQPMWLIDLARDGLQRHTKAPVLRWKRHKESGWGSPAAPTKAKGTKPTPKTAPTPRRLAAPAPAVAMGVFTMKFRKLLSPKSRKNLVTIGHLYSSFEKMWRANVPVHPQFDTMPTPGSVKKASDLTAFVAEITHAQKTLRTIAHQRRAAAYLLEINDPKVGPLFSWMRRSPVKTDAQLHLIAQIRKRVGIISFHTPIRSGTWRIRMAHVLLGSSQRLLNELAKKLLRHPISAAMPPPMRLLRARLYHEQGNYTQALQELFGTAPNKSDASDAKTSIMLAFYHPQLQFKVMPGDTRGTLAANWSASFDHTKTHNNGTPLTPLLQISATTPGGKLRPVLTLKGLPPLEVQRLLGWLNQTNAPWRRVKKPAQPLLLSEQLLLLQVPIRPEIKEMYQQLNTKELRRRMAIELAFGCHPPSAITIPMSRPCKHAFFKPPTVLRFLPPLSVKGQRKSK